MDLKLDYLNILIFTIFAADDLGCWRGGFKIIHQQHLDAGKNFVPREIPQPASAATNTQHEDSRRKGGRRGGEERLWKVQVQVSGGHPQGNTRGSLRRGYGVRWRSGKEFWQGESLLRATGGSYHNYNSNKNRLVEFHLWQWLSLVWKVVSL